MKTNVRIWAGALVLAATAALSAAGARAAEPSLTVVELFTSQGCSSCPPADRFLGELAKRDGVLALSVHVDYWDYIGWKDPFGDPAHGVRQKAYADRFALRYVYTPQMVVQGAYQAVGSKRGEVELQIKKARALPHVNPSLRRDGRAIELSLPKSEVAGPIDVITVFYDRRHETRIRRGENGGRALAYYNVVREMKPFAVWNGEATRMAIAMSDAGGEVCAVILQERKSRRIIGAARLDLDAR